MLAEEKDEEKGSGDSKGSGKVKDDTTKDHKMIEDEAKGEGHVSRSALFAFLR